jgi:hypothetical protein
MVEAFRANGVEPPRAIVTTTSGHLRDTLLATGRFLTVLPESLLQFPIKLSSLKVLPVELPTTRETTRIMTLKNRALPGGAALHRMRPRGREAAGKSPAVMFWPTLATRLAGCSEAQPALRANSLNLGGLPSLLFPQCFLEPLPNISAKMATPPNL